MTDEGETAATSTQQRNKAEFAKVLNFSSPQTEGKNMVTPTPDGQALILRAADHAFTRDAEARLALVMKDLFAEKQARAALEKDLLLMRGKLKKTHERGDSKSTAYNSRRSSRTRA